MSTTSEHGMGSAVRTFIIGKNSTVWKRLRDRSVLAAADIVAISHNEVSATAISGNDVVWIFSYSRNGNENRSLMERLRAKGAGCYHYLSTASANVARRTSCYEYPRAKAEAERDAIRILNAEIVRVGLVCGQEDELPAGVNAATSLDDLARYILHSSQGKPGTTCNLFKMVDRPFRSELERLLFGIYGLLLYLSGPFPCLLRPIDLLLRMSGVRWYGYLYLSNRLWLGEH